MNGTPSAFARAGLSVVTMNAGVYHAGPDGRLYVEIPAQPFEGGVAGWKDVPVLGFGGTAGRFAHFGRPTAQAAPPELPSQLAVVFVGTSRRPWAALDTYAAGSLVGETVETGANTDRSQDVSPADHAWKNGGGAVILDAYGRIALIAGNNPDISAQLGGSGKLRVSREGNASGVPVLKAPWQNFESSLRTQLNVMLARLAACEAYILASTPLPIPIPPVNFPDPSSAAVGAAAVRFPSTTE